MLIIKKLKVVLISIRTYSRAKEGPLVSQRAFINVGSDLLSRSRTTIGVGALASVFAMALRRFTPAITTNNIGIDPLSRTDSFWFLVFSYREL
jgi:hypothetical protein